MHAGWKYRIHPFRSCKVYKKWLIRLLFYSSKQGYWIIWMYCSNISCSGHTYKVFLKLYFNLDHEKQVICSFISPKEEKWPLTVDVIKLFHEKQVIFSFISPKEEKWLLTVGVIKLFHEKQVIFSFISPKEEKWLLSVGVIKLFHEKQVNLALFLQKKKSDFLLWM
jgi:hypothetical protein